MLTPEREAEIRAGYKDRFGNPYSLPDVRDLLAEIDRLRLGMADDRAALGERITERNEERA
jgi:hypothetical protein